MESIFLSYRRSDTEAITERIYEHLVDNFGKKNIFRDIASIEPGENFRGALAQALSRCGVMLAIIGQDWSDTRDKEGHRRLDDPGDFVRIEIATGLARKDVRVIPVLIDEVKMSAPASLPFELRQLTDQHALSVRSDDTHFNKDMERLIAAIDRATAGDLPSQIQRHLDDLADEITTKVNNRLIEFQERVETRLSAFVPLANSIRLVAKQRRGFDEYYTWVISDATDQDLFFAGRSVLHRIQDDVEVRSGAALEEILAKKLLGGASIRVLFLDPRSKLIDRLAKDEGQPPEQMLNDIATSLGICRRLHGVLRKYPRFPGQAQLDVRIYDEIPYFAYHRENQKMYVGFYFSTSLGYRSAAFEAHDPEAQSFFENHFIHIFSRYEDQFIVKLPTFRGAPIFNENLFEELRTFLSQRLGEERVKQLLDPAGETEVADGI